MMGVSSGNIQFFIGLFFHLVETNAPGCKYFIKARDAGEDLHSKSSRKNPENNTSLTIQY